MGGVDNEVPPASRLQVLVAEDSPVNAFVLTGQLTALGYEVTVASDGEAAWTALVRGCFAALLTDCEMPVLDGYGLAMRVRSVEAYARLPIIALSARPDQAQVARCRQAGMDACLAKPVSRDVLAAALAHPHEVPYPADESVESNDLEALQRLYPNRRALMAVLEAFVHAAHADLLELDRLYVTSTPSQTGKVLHRLVGSLQLLNQPGLAKRLDQWYRRNAVPPPDEFRQLRAEVSALVGRVQTWRERLRVLEQC